MEPETFVWWRFLVVIAEKRVEEYGLMKKSPQNSQQETFDQGEKAA